MEICWKLEERSRSGGSRSGGRWGTVCDNQWSSAHTEVLCRSLGFAPYGNVLTVKVITQ